MEPPQRQDGRGFQRGSAGTCVDGNVTVDGGVKAVKTNAAFSQLLENRFYAGGPRDFGSSPEVADPEFVGFASQMKFAFAVVPRAGGNGDVLIDGDRKRQAFVALGEPAEQF